MSPTRTTLSAAAALLAAAAAPVASGFAPPRRAAAPPSPPSSSALPMSSTAFPADAEDAELMLLSYASLCARSDSCSVDSAESYLNEILSVQNDCAPAAAGTTTGNRVCDDVLEVSRVVADLRAKVRDGAGRRAGTFWVRRQEELADLAARADSGPMALLTAPVKPAYLAVLALYVVAVASALQPGVADASGVAPFTAQEVWWAVRDGYAADLAAHAFHHGGLLVGDAAASSVGGSLTPQELAWSIRDGYLGNALLSRGGAEGGVAVPFTPQELYWAIQHGYSCDMMAHWFRNGGLAV